MRVEFVWPARRAQRLGDGMAEERARLSLPRRFSSIPWSREQIAEALGPRRDRLVDQLPREIAAARGLSRDQLELIVDEAIDFMVTEYDRPVTSEEVLERAFWAAASFRVKRTHEGRGATVRAGWQRVDIETTELSARDGDPSARVLEREEEQTLLEFAATLTDAERLVLAHKYGSSTRELGRVVVARRLGMSPAAVRRAERSITRKLERFIAILSAGTLCAHRLPLVTSLAEDAVGEDPARIARAHLAHCPACRAEYVRHLRALRSGELPRRIGELLPVPPITEAARHWRSGIRDTIVDWATRPLAQDAATTGAQAATAGRGVGTAVAVKLVTLCIGGAAAVGGGALCVQALVQRDRPAKPTQPRAELRHRASRGREPVLPTAGRSVAMQPTATPTAVRRKVNPTQRHRVPAATATPAASTVTTSQHEQATAISPPPATSSSSTGEFDPGPAASAPAQPAAAPAGGGPEFP